MKMPNMRSRMSIGNKIVRESLAEFLGTLSLVFIGNSGILNSIVNPSVNVSHVYGIALMVSVYATGGVSGGHLNPAVTLALVLTGRCKSNRIAPFWVSQYLGAFVGSTLTHALFYETIRAIDPNTEKYQMVFATYPGIHVSAAGAFVDQLIGTALLLFCVMAITDSRNMAVAPGLVPIALGLALVAVLDCTSANTGAALNPARDLAPRLYSLLIGYEHAFTLGGQGWSHFWWIPVVACHVGAVLGALIYVIFIELHHPREEFKETVSSNGAPDDYYLYRIPTHYQGGVPDKSEDAVSSPSQKPRLAHDNPVFSTIDELGDKHQQAFTLTDSKEQHK